MGMRSNGLAGICLLALSAGAQAASYWQSAPEFTPPFSIVSDGSDNGARFADLDGDGRADFLYHRSYNGGQIQKGAYLSTDSGWEYAQAYEPPFHIVADGNDMGARLVDVNGDGLVDFLYRRYYTFCSGSPHCAGSQVGAYLNTGSGWRSEPAFAPPYSIVIGNGEDAGARFADVNGDGRADFLYRRYFDGQVQSGAYLSTDSGWQPAPEFAPPFSIVADTEDTGVRLVDANGDGRTDFLYRRHYETCPDPLCDNTYAGAYLSTSSGWQSASSFSPPVSIVSNGNDTGVRFADVDGDGRPDLLHRRTYNGGQIQKGAYLNTGSGWLYTDAFVPPFPIIGENKDMGVRLVDVNGDGRTDFLYRRYYNGSSQAGAYLSTGTGWVSVVDFAPLFSIVADGKDTGARFADVDADGLPDFLYRRWYNNGQVQKGAYLNGGAAAPPPN